MAPELAVSGDIERVHHVFFARLTYTGVVHRECGRCLQQYDLPVSGVRKFVFKPEDDDGAYVRSETDVLTYTYAEGWVDVEEYLYEDLLLQVPMKAVCSKECSGVSSYSTKNEKGSSGVDHRWHALLKLQNSTNNNLE
ncbi:hypothetical protein CALK_0722 [Chitinivibrio alkaliphilus ACht1]|uniref:Uncharacterized protein n=2 Tax=Chitinivibrio TaxID=1505231 RepID=U7D6W4_9BACT|nr:hypothetical protein CALK_0722 [Chitinivibrio alkaliphilus ACht1]